MITSMPSVYYVCFAQLAIYSRMGFPGGSAGRESACTVGDWVPSLGLGRSPGEGKGYPLQYSGKENAMDCKSMGAQRVGQDRKSVV